VETLIKVQARPPIDLVQARAGVGAAQLRRIAAENELAQARAELCQAMGQPAWSADEFELADGELSPVTGENDGARELAAGAEAARPDLAGSVRAIEGAARALAGARGGFGPTFRLVLSATDAGPMLDPGPFDRGNLRWNYSAAMVMTWPIFEGGRTQAGVREADAGLQEARARHRLLALDVGVEVERARRGVAAGKASVEIAVLTLDNARERLRLAEGRYQAGVGTALEVSDAQLGESTAAAQAVQARYDLATARAQLLHALGQSR
jgi:outer membrane protein